MTKFLLFLLKLIGILFCLYILFAFVAGIIFAFTWR